MISDTTILTGIIATAAVNIIIGFMNITLLGWDWKKIPMRPIWKALYDAGAASAIPGNALVITALTTMTIPSQTARLRIAVVVIGCIIMMLTLCIYGPRWHLGRLVRWVFLKPT